jgi:hypothetical protein
VAGDDERATVPARRAAVGAGEDAGERRGRAIAGAGRDVGGRVPVRMLPRWAFEQQPAAQHGRGLTGGRSQEPVKIIPREVRAASADESTSASHRRVDVPLAERSAATGHRRRLRGADHRKGNPSRHLTVAQSQAIGQSYVVRSEALPSASAS